PSSGWSTSRSTHEHAGAWTHPRQTAFWAQHTLDRSSVCPDTLCCWPATNAEPHPKTVFALNQRHWYNWGTSPMTVHRLISVNANATKEFRKLPLAEGRLIADFGLEGDRHAGRPLRQVTLLNVETVRELAHKGMPVEPGVLGENITV